MTIPHLQYLIAELIQNSQSGHPGAAITLTELFHILYRHLRYDPDDSLWVDRDALILSNGHTCILQYLYLHLTNRLSFQDLLNFRSINSNTPGHPEVHTNGIEVCTGPLGQGLANAVGFGLSQRLVNANGVTVVVFGDGCYMEGVSHEAFSLASHYRPRVIFIYDFNDVTIDGSTELSMGDCPIKRFEGYGFNVKVCQGYEGVEDILRTKIDYMRNTKSDKDIKHKDLLDERLLMLVLKNKIAVGTSLEGKAKTHGAPLGREVIDQFAVSMNIEEKGMQIPKDIYDEFEVLNSKNREIRREWNEEMAKFRENKELINSKTPFYNRIPDFNPYDCKKYHFAVNESLIDNIFMAQKPVNKKMATRKTLNNALELCTGHLPFLILGSADLASSCLTRVKNSLDITSISTEGSYIHYGVREHGMFGVMNGLSAHGLFLPLGSTFLNFISYGFPAVRLAALSKFPGIFIMTHDSIGLGEDGPTHQPIEILPLLRATPGLVVFRPCDQTETFYAMKYALLKKGPVVLSLSRQDISPVLNTDYLKCSKGAYYVHRGDLSKFTLLASGSEVPLAIEVAQMLGGDVVSMLSMELFEEQSADYRKDILNGIVISIEASSTFGWHKYACLCIGIDSFGRSGKCEDVMKEFGFCVESIIERIKNHFEWE